MRPQGPGVVVATVLCRRVVRTDIVRAPRRSEAATDHFLLITDQSAVRATVAGAALGELLVLDCPWV